MKSKQEQHAWYAGADPGILEGKGERGSGSSKRQIRRNCQTDKQRNPVCVWGGGC